MTNSFVNGVHFYADHSPYHPRNMMRSRLLKQKLAEFEQSDDRQIAITSDFYDLEDDWRRIEAEDHVSVHQSFNWCRTWCEAHDIDPVLITLSINGRVEFILPLEVKSRLGMKRARLIGADHSNINFILASRAFILQMKPDFLQRLQKELKAHHLPFDVIHLEKMRVSFEGVVNPFSSVTNLLNQNASFQLPLLDTVEDTFAQINAKRKRKMARTVAKRLSAHGEHRYLISKTMAEHEKIISAFFEQKAMRFKNKGLPNAFADDEIQNFFSKMTKLEKDAVGKLELHAIIFDMDERPFNVIAIAAVTEKNGHVICQFSSFDEELAAKTQTSPGEFLFYQAIENMVLRGMRQFDFGIGDQPYKHSWCTLSSEHYDGFIVLNISGHIIAALETFKTNLKRWIKSSPTLLRLANHLRK